MAIKAKWMIDVLDDLVSFCELNGIVNAVEHLGRARSIIANETSQDKEEQKTRSISKNQPIT